MSIIFCCLILKVVIYNHKKSVKGQYIRIILIYTYAVQLNDM